MELRGQRHRVTMPGILAAAGDEGAALQGVLEFDRTRWGSRYGSGRLYDRLGMHLVNDFVTIQVRIVGNK